MENVMSVQCLACGKNYSENDILDYHIKNSYPGKSRAALKELIYATEGDKNRTLRATQCSKCSKWELAPTYR